MWLAGQASSHCPYLHLCFISREQTPVGPNFGGKWLHQHSSFIKWPCCFYCFSSSLPLSPSTPSPSLSSSLLLFLLLCLCCPTLYPIIELQLSLYVYFSTVWFGARWTVIPKWCYTSHFPVLPSSSLESSSRKLSAGFGLRGGWFRLRVWLMLPECSHALLPFPAFSAVGLGSWMTLSSRECGLTVISLLLCIINSQCAWFILSAPLEAMCWNDRELRWKQLPSLSEGRLPRGSPDLGGFFMNKNFTHPVWYTQLS